MLELAKQSVFTFCKMSETVPFFEHMDSKFAKSVNMMPNNFSLINIVWGIKKTSFVC
jgi:hypothetical protein